VRGKVKNNSIKRAFFLLPLHVSWQKYFNPFQTRSISTKDAYILNKGWFKVVSLLLQHILVVITA
jgi:hypothetical protein